jgi:DNA-binding NarL/FixJ family response regulator
MKINRLRVIAIENDIQFHEAYRYYFSKYADFPLVGLFSSVEDALIDFKETKPDIIITELSLPGTLGIDCFSNFRKMNPDVKIIVASEENDFKMIKRAFKNGANGFLTKPLTKKRLKNALYSVKYDGAVLSNDIAAKLIAMFHQKSYNFFSKRENQIVEFLCQGATYKSIADQLFVTTSTINFHIQNIYLKLDVSSKSEALEKLRELEYVTQMP